MSFSKVGVAMKRAIPILTLAIGFAVGRLLSTASLEASVALKKPPITEAVAALQAELAILKGKVTANATAIGTTNTKLGTTTRTANTAKTQSNTNKSTLTSCIKSLTVGHSSGRATAKANAAKGGHTLLDLDLNHKAGGNYIYIGYKK